MCEMLTIKENVHKVINMLITSVTVVF